MQQFLHVYGNGDYIKKYIFSVYIPNGMFTFFNRENGKKK